MKPTRLFTADEGKKSVGLSGPDSIEKDIDVINTMFDPLENHEDGSEGGIQEENLGTALAEKVNISLENSTNAVDTLIPGLEENKADREEIYTKTELNNGQLDNRYYTETELNNGVLDGRYYTETELNNNQLGTLYYTKSQLSPFLAGGSVPIYTDKFTIVNSDNEDGTFTYHYKSQDIVSEIVNEDTQVFTIIGNTYPHGNDSLLVYVDGVPFKSIEGNEVLELSDTTFGLRPIQSSDMVITIKYVNSTGIIAVDNVVQQLEDVTQQSLEVLEMLPTKADLDITGSVPVEQLSNTQYMKDWYGRGVKKLVPNEFWSPNKKLLQSLIDVNSQMLVDTEYSIGSDKFKIHTLNNNLPVVNNFGIIQHSASANRTIFGISTTATTGVGYLHTVITSTTKYDLTNVDSVNLDIALTANDNLDFEVSTLKLEVGFINVGANIDCPTYDSPTLLTTGSINNSAFFSKKSVVIDTTNITGECLMVVRLSGRKNSVATANYLYAGIYNVRYYEKHPTLNFVNNKYELHPYILNATFDLGDVSIPSRFLDWYNLNALVDTPQETNVRFDIYDNYDVLLKADVKQGDILKLTNPIIKPKITLSRDTLETPSPTFSWLEIGYRGKQTFEGMWNKIAEITLGVITAQLDISIIENLKEIKIVGRNIKSNSGTNLALRMMLNGDNSSNAYSMKYISGTTISELHQIYALISNSDIRLDSSSSFEIIIKENMINTSVVCNLGTTQSTTTGIGKWKNYAPINEISLLLSAKEFAVGSTFEIWGRYYD